MQEKEMTRTDTATLIFKCEAVAAAVSSCKLQELLDEVVRALTEQEDTIRHLRTELCNASAVAMEHIEAIKALGGQVA